MDFLSYTDYKINSANLIYNVNKIKSNLSKNVKFCAVVKADAYGVGALDVAKAIENYVDCFAVASLTEGIELRSVVKNKNILILGTLNLLDIDAYSFYNLIPTVSSIFEMSKLSKDVKNPIMVEFGLNTGMNRIGFDTQLEILDAIMIKNKNPNISIFGAYSHFSTKENNVDFMIKQSERFKELLIAFNGENVIRHISNSNASLFHPEFNFDMVRVGFGLYGMDETFGGLNPVVSIHTRIMLIREVNSGDMIGYDCTYCASEKRRIAILPIGYYDGLARGLSNKGRVLINGCFAPIVGRVCMDMVMVDITGIQDAEVGSDVVIIGKQNKNEITLSEHARLLNSSEYEVLVRFNKNRMNVII